MYEISCEMCRDLMPLVKDGIAGEDSRAAVEHHLAGCHACRGLFEAPPPADDGKALLSALRRRVRMLSLCLMLAGLLLGLSLTGGGNLFYNVILMPAMGGLSYLVYRRQALSRLPLLMLGLGLLSHLMTRLNGGDGEPLPGLLLWVLIYCGFALAGLVIAALLDFALGKEDAP